MNIRLLRIRRWRRCAVKTGLAPKVNEIEVSVPDRMPNR
jgi:hypothetical protein